MDFKSIYFSFITRSFTTNIGSIANQPGGKIAELLTPLMKRQKYEPFVKSLKHKLLYLMLNHPLQRKGTLRTRLFSEQNR
jgi:hypothetical protein